MDKRNSPIYKESKMADSDHDQSPNGANTATNIMALSDRMDKMFEVLNSVKKGQDSLRQIFDSNVDKLRKDLLSTVDDKI